jgi:hypothetical protein
MAPLSCFPTLSAIHDAALGTIRVYHECANGSVKVCS